MSLKATGSYSKRMEQRAARYMQEIRDVVKAGLSRRELLRMGLVAGGAGVVAMKGMRNFRPYWAYAASGSGSGGSLELRSPRNTPFVDPLPIPPVMTPVA